MVICEAWARLWRRFVLGVTVALACGLSLTSPASGQFADSGVKCNGTADDTTAISRANAAAGAQTVVLSPGICRITSNVTLTATLHFDSGAQFAIERGVTVTIQGEIVAPLRRIFSGAGSVVFDNSRVVPVLHPEWWGAVHDGTTDDSGAIQAAVHAVSAGQVIELQTGVYIVGAALAINRSLSLRGRNPLSTELRWTGGSGTLLTVTAAANYVHLDNFLINNTGGGVVGIQINGSHTAVSRIRTNPAVRWSTAALRTDTTAAVFNIVFRECQIYSSAAGRENPIGLHIGWANRVTVDQCYFSGNVVGVRVGAVGAATTSVSVVNSIFDVFAGADPQHPGASTAVGLDLNSGVDSVFVAGNHFEVAGDQTAAGAGNRAIRISSGKSVAIVGNWMGGSGQADTLIHVRNAAVTGVDIRGNYFTRIATARGNGYAVTIDSAAAGALVHVGPNRVNIAAGLVNPMNAYTEVPLIYGTAINIDASQGNPSGTTSFVLNVTNSTAFAINAPTNPTKGQMISLRIRNISRGPMGGVMWALRYKLAAWVNPANSMSRSITFAYDGVDWIEVSRTVTEVPN